MSTLRISNIEAKADNSSPTVDEQLKFTNSTGDVLLHLDGRTSGITTVGINTTAQTIKFDENNNVFITGIVTATELHGTVAVGTSVTYGDNEKAYFGNGLDLQIYHAAGAASHINNTGLLNIDGTTGVRLEYNNSTRVDCTSDGVSLVGGVGIADSIYHTGDTNTAIRFPATDTFSVETAGQQNVQVNGTRTLLKSPNGTDTTIRLQHQGNSGYGDIILDRTKNAFIISNDPTNASNNLSYFSVKNKGTENLRIDSSGITTFTSQIYQTASGSNTAKITLNNASDTTGMDVGYSESSGLGFINVGQSGSGLSIKTGGTASGNERLLVQSDGQKIVKNGRLNILSTFIDFSGNISVPQTGAAIFRPVADTVAISCNNLERFRVDSTGNLHLRSASTCRLVLGSQGGTLGDLTNNENWIRGSGNMIQLNTAGGDYGFEVLGSQKMKLDASGNLELRSAAQNRITFGSAGSSGNDTNWIRGDADKLMFNCRTGGGFDWEVNGSLIAEMTSAKKVQGILVGKREYTVSMPAHTTWYYVCTVHSNNLCSQVEFRVNGTRDSTVFNAHFDVISTHAAPQYHVTSTGCNYTAVYMKMQGNNYGAYNVYIKRSGTTGALNASVRAYPRMNEFIDENEDSGYTSTAFEVTAFSGKRIWSSTANNADLDVHGSITGASKNFKIPHPLTSLKDAKRLVHASIEGPSCDLIYRGTATLSSGSATVNIDSIAGMTDGTFAALNKNVQCFTTNESGWGAVKGSVSGNILTITAQDGSSTDNVSWMVVGQRKDDTIKELDSTDANGDLVLEPSIDPTETSPSDSYPSNPSQYDSL